MIWRMSSENERLSHKIVAKLRKYRLGNNSWIEFWPNCFLHRSLDGINALWSGVGCGALTVLIC